MKKCCKVFSAVIALIMVFTMAAGFSAGASAYQSEGSKVNGKLESSISQKDRPQTPIAPETGGGGYETDIPIDFDWDPNGSVTGLKLTNTGILTNTVTLTWDTYPSAQGYEVWYAKNKYSSFNHKADVTDTRYIDTSGSLTGCYKVRAYITYEWGEREYSRFSEPVSFELRCRHAIIDSSYSKDDVSIVNESMFSDSRLNDIHFEKDDSDDGSVTDSSEDDTNTGYGGFTVDVGVSDETWDPETDDFA